MRKSIFIFCMLAAALLGGCKDADVKDVVGYPDDGQVHFRASFPGEGGDQSRVAEDGTTWENADVISIFPSLDNSRNNYQFIENAWNAIHDGIIYVPSVKQSYKAFYPGTMDFNPIDNLVTVNVADQFTTDNLEYIDFMYAATAETLSSQVNLVFNRQLTKVSFELFETNETGIENLTEWTITLNGVNLVGGFNLETGQFEDLVVAASIEIPIRDHLANDRITFNSVTKSYTFDMYLLPQGDLSGVTLTATKGDVTYTARPSATSSWAAGTANTFAVTFGTQTYYLADFVDDMILPKGKIWRIHDINADNTLTKDNFKGLHRAVARATDGSIEDMVSLEFPNLKYVPESAFEGFDNVNSIVMPSATHIYNNAFNVWRGLQKINIGYVENATIENDHAHIKYISPQLIQSGATMNEIDLFMGYYWDLDDPDSSIVISKDASDLNWLSITGVDGGSSVNYNFKTITSPQVFTLAQFSRYSYWGDNEPYPDSGTWRIMDSGTPSVSEFFNLVATLRRVVDASKMVTLDFPNLTAFPEYAFAFSSQEDYNTHINYEYGDTRPELGTGGYNSIKAHNLLEIGSGAFQESVDLESIDFPVLQTVTGDNCFENTKIVTLNQPTVTSFGGFGDSKYLETVTLENATSIASFFRCTALKSVSIPKLQEINDGEYSSGFGLCENITELYFPYLTTVTGGYAFHGMKNLETIYLPNLTVINGTDAFTECPKLQRLELPSLEYAPKYLCGSSSGLNYIYLPSVTGAGNLSFSKLHPSLSGIADLYVGYNKEDPSWSRTLTEFSSTAFTPSSAGLTGNYPKVNLYVGFFDLPPINSAFVDSDNDKVEYGSAGSSNYDTFNSVVQAPN